MGISCGFLKCPITPVYTKVNYGEMNSISITYSLKYEVSFAPHYKFTSCKKCINCKTGREIRKVYQKGSIGYCIAGRFYSLKFLRLHLVKIENEYCPFLNKQKPRQSVGFLH